MQHGSFPHRWRSPWVPSTDNSSIPRLSQLAACCYSFFFLESMTLDPTYPLFPVVAFIGFVAVLVPLPWHLQAWNSGTCFFMMWTALACLNQFVNSIVWSGNVVNHSPAWCEICMSNSTLRIWASLMT